MVVPSQKIRRNEFVKKIKFLRYRVLHFVWRYGTRLSQSSAVGSDLMSDVPKRMSPPYATFGSFISFLNNLRDTTMPQRIDRSVFGNASGSIIYSVLAALRSLNLIDDVGTPSSDLVDLVNASDEDRKPLLRKILRAGYPTLFNGQINLAAVTAGQFDEHIRNEYDLKGSTIDKIAAFFIAAATTAEIPISPHLKGRRATSPSSSSKKSAKQRKKSEGDVRHNLIVQPDTQIQSSSKKVSELLLEHFDPNEMTDEQQSAIWILLKYFKSVGK